MLDPHVKGHGIGSAMMHEVIAIAATANAEHIDIAASQHSAEFFAHFGAVELQRSKDGWGPGMDRINMELPVSAATPNRDCN